jgi:protein-S-isoprenylcysteine O-methyltransferase Ste14
MKTDDRLPARGPGLPPLYFLAAIGLMVGLNLWLPVARLMDFPERYSGLPFIIGGIWLILWAAYLFQQAGTTIKPFEGASTLVKRGPYRVSRNPIYLGLTIALVGVSLLLGAASPWIVVPLFVLAIDRRFILFEEASLRRTFGSEYTTYRKKVRRWL